MNDLMLPRRTLLLGVVMAAAAACVRPAPRPEPTSTAERLPDQDRWEQEARGILLDGLETLRTFEVFVAFRVGVADASRLAWDPPTHAAWDEATHVARGLHGRAEQLLRQVSTSTTDEGSWRFRRELADKSAGLLELGDALAAYRTRVDLLAPGGDGTSSWDLLDRAWAIWESNAEHWGLSRAETIACN